jgi:beta-lactamase class A
LPASSLLTSPVRLNAAASHYQFIDPLLGLKTQKDQYPETRALARDLEKKINEEKIQGRAEKISVYFRTQESGDWTTAGDDTEYHPASLLKVGTLIGYLKQAEITPGILFKKITYQPSGKEFPTDKNVPEADAEIVPGGTYTIEQLLRNMILKSDNVALALLASKRVQSEILPGDPINEVFKDLGIMFPNDKPREEYLLSPQTYSLFFRVLYNATILTRETSDQALKLLSEVEFKDGLVAGLPGNITVSHKFGVYDHKNSIGDVTAIELHDCGIVYYPGHPYTICVMTYGQNFQNLAAAIADLSRLTYDNINLLNK